jgi:hypothetical protein
MLLTKKDSDFFHNDVIRRLQIPADFPREISVSLICVIGEICGRPTIKAQCAARAKLDLAKPAAVASVIVGPRNEEQLRQNLGAVGWNPTREHVAKLDAASELPSAYPYWHQIQFADRNPPSIQISKA